MPQGGDGGMRRFGSNVVSSVGTLDKDDRRKKEIRIQFPGTKTFEGDSGGPCLIEDGEARWLVGIVGGYGEGEWGKEPWITNIFGYRDWIEKQVAETAKLNIR
jgi:secreted trypsin-like serine protease